YLIASINQSQAEIFLFGTIGTRKLAVATHLPNRRQAQDVTAADEKRHFGDRSAFAGSGLVWRNDIEGHGRYIGVGIKDVRRESDLISRKKPSVVIEADIVVLTRIQHHPVARRHITLGVIHP